MFYAGLSALIWGWSHGPGVKGRPEQDSGDKLGQLVVMRSKGRLGQLDLLVSTASCMPVRVFTAVQSSPKVDSVCIHSGADSAFVSGAESVNEVKIEVDLLLLAFSFFVIETSNSPLPLRCPFLDFSSIQLKKKKKDTTLWVLLTHETEDCLTR